MTEKSAYESLNRAVAEATKAFGEAARHAGAELQKFMEEWRASVERDQQNR